MRRAAAAALLLLASVAVSPALAQSSPPAPALSPAAAPTSTPAPQRRRLFAPGPQFVSVGIAISPRVQTEFAPGSTLGFTTLAVWNSGETVVLGRFHVASYTDYRTLTYPHAAGDPVTTVGGGGSTLVSAFNVHQDELENGGGVRVLPNVYAGLGTVGIQGNVGYPQLRGIGEVLMLQPAVQPIVAPYARLFYTANAGGIYTLADQQRTALTYRGWRYHAGVLIREPGTRLALDLGYAGERLIDRTNAPAPWQETMITLGINLRF